MKTDARKGHLDLLILAVLGDRPLHGYAIIEELRRRSGGYFDFPEGTIYPALHRLEQADSLASAWQRTGGRRRRVYRLTARGTAALSSETLEWRRFAGAVLKVLGARA